MEKLERLIDLAYFYLNIITVVEIVKIFLSVVGVICKAISEYIERN